MAGEKIAFIGSGSVGGSLGKRLEGWFEVRYAERGSSAAVAWADVVFLAVPGNVAVEAAGPHAAELAGKILVDCTNPLVWKGGPVWAPPAQGSTAAALAEAIPGAHVIKAWNTFGAEFHADPLHAGPPAAEVFMAGDSAEAKTTLAAIATQAGFRPVDSGPLRNAAVLENLAMLWIHLALVGGRGRGFVFAMQDKR